MTEKCYVWWKLKIVITHCSFRKVGILFDIFLITTGKTGRGCSPRNQTLFSCKLVALFSYARKQRPGLITQVFQGLFLITTFKILHSPPPPAPTHPCKWRSTLLSPKNPCLLNLSQRHLPVSTYLCEHTPLPNSWVKTSLNRILKRSSKRVHLYE